MAQPLALEGGHSPHVILMVGVNGSGKTTTIGKLTAKLTAEGKKVVLAAGDTFRAAAVEQLQIWGERSNVEVITRPTGLMHLDWHLMRSTKPKHKARTC